METDPTYNVNTNAETPPSAQSPTGAPINPVNPVQMPTQPDSLSTVQNINQSPQPNQSPNVVDMVTGTKKSSNFAIFLIISVVIIFFIWGFVAYLYFQNQGLGG